MDERQTLLRIWFSLLVFTFPLIFLIRFLFSKTTKKMLEGMTGDNQRWDWSEIWEAASLFMALGSWGAMLTMLYLISAFESKYPVEAWVAVMVSTAGSNGVQALIIYMKGKYGTKT